MNCRRCSLINPPTAKRCDCGYDFETKTVEASYYQQPMPGEVRSALVLIVGYNAALAIVALVMGNAWHLLAAVSWGLLAYVLYGQLVRRKDWARKVLALVTFPAGAFLFLSTEMRLYCQQRADLQSTQRPSTNDAGSKVPGLGPPRG
jgi:hypothetical protein